MKPIVLSPSSLNLYLECQHCFWLDKKGGIRRPVPYPYSLNGQVDNLLKEEFDTYRRRGEQPNVLRKLNPPAGGQAKLLENQRLIDKWRDGRQGIRYYDKKLQATLMGAPDDILEFKDKKLAPLDYKSAAGNIAKIYDQFQLQMDIYAFLLEKNGHQTTGKAYLAFYLVDADKGFVDRLPFRKEIHQIKTDPADVHEIFSEAVALLDTDAPPKHAGDCSYGKFIHRAAPFTVQA